MSKFQMYSELKTKYWYDDVEAILYVANELYPNKRGNFGRKMYLYKKFLWFWCKNIPDINKLKKGDGPLRYASSRYPVIMDVELQQDEDHIPGRGNAREEAWMADVYHKRRIKMQCINALLYKVSLELQL